MSISWTKRIFPGRDKGVIYDDTFFRAEWFENWEVLKSVLYELIKTEGNWKNILDFGCGPGVMIDHMNDRGYNYVGCDYSEQARALYLKHYGKYPQKYVKSLQECSDTKFDLFLAFDVFEHMADKEIRLLLQKINWIPTLFLNISRVKNIPGHINIKNDRKWIKFLKKEGLHCFEAATIRIRKHYARLRPGSPDLWDKNIFIFLRE